MSSHDPSAPLAAAQHPPELAPSAADEDPRIRQLEAEIAQTRSGMSETVDAIQLKLSPDLLAAQAKEKLSEVAEQAIQETKERALEAIKEVAAQARSQARETVQDVSGQVGHAMREATVGRAERMLSAVGETATEVEMTMMETIKQHPLPATLAALSLGWLFMNRSKGQPAGGGQPSAGRAYGGQAAGGYAGYGGGAGGSHYAQWTDEGSEHGPVGQIASSASEAASSAMSSAGQAVSSAGGTAAGLGSSLVDTITGNPLPAALTGVGLAWLMMSRSSSGQRPADARSAGHTWAGSTTGAGGYPQWSDDHSPTAGLQDRAGELAESAGELAGGAQEQARQLPGRLQRMVQENPLMAGALAVSVGAAIGMATPDSGAEDQLFGSARDKLMSRARGTTQQTFEKVQRVAGEAQEAVKRSAEEQKLTS